MVTIKEIKARAPNAFFPRATASIAVVCMLVLAGHGTSQSTPQDEGHALQAQVEAALAQHGVSVPADLQFLLEPPALDALAAYYAHALSNGQGPWDTTALVLLLRQGLQDNPVLADHPEAEHIMDGVDEDVQKLLDALKQPTGMCMHDGSDLVPEVGLLAGPSCLLMKTAGPALLIATIVLAIVAPLAVEGAKIVFYLDDDGNEIGDDWGDYWKDVSGRFSLATDWDEDGLGNVQEFRWELYPFCRASLPDDPRTQLVDESLLSASNCTDYDNDNWMDGPEVQYWNNIENDILLTGEGITFLDPDRTLNTDDDTIRNTYDPDSDNDDLLDGDEIAVGSYPEFEDSDCDVTATQCTPSTDSSSYYDTTRLGQPGTGDGIFDNDELTQWQTIVGPGSWNVDHDGDGIQNNLLDPDSDGDGLLDGEEFLLGRGQVRPDRVDTDVDGVHDGDERLWHEDSDGDGLVNANDPDSDNDGMPDWYEHQHNFDQTLAADAGFDRDGDELTNLGEYQADTDPTNPDTEGDGLWDGDEVLVYETDPFHWDSDRDGMPDVFEAENGLNPNDGGDANLDEDGDSYVIDGIVVQPWTNLMEYQYERPSTWNEATSGPWRLGTDPDNPNTDGDVQTDGSPAWDGYEVYKGTDPRLPSGAEAEDADPDGDGLTTAQELSIGTDPNDPDWDNDGLCDGGRGENCNFPGSGTTGFQPGEADYGSNPFDFDSDGDGLHDGQEAQRWDPGASGEDLDADNDGQGGITDPDNDGDSLSDGDEVNIHHTDPANPDSDADRLRDGDEVNVHGTDPSNEDTDDDDLWDGDELDVHGTQPLNPDSDGDTLRDGDEIFQHGTDPTRVDTEGDGMPDDWEVAHDLNPRVDDSNDDPDDDGARAGDTLPHTGDPTSWSILHRFTNLLEYEAGTDPHDDDTDGDELPDGWEVFFGFDPLDPFLFDADSDGLFEWDELRWRLVPACVPGFQNCWDHEQDRLTGSGGDAWRDGDEVLYWNDPSNDGITVEGIEYLLEDPDARMDSDDDGLRNLEDPDSDNDGLVDGVEQPNGAYPELRDSDCTINAASCTSSFEVTSRVDAREGNPGTGDLIDDGDEYLAWQALGFNAHLVDYDGDGIASNLVDPDSDGDGLLDGQEFLLGRGQVRPDLVDTEGDGVPDGEEVAWSEDTDGDGLVNANDPDSDNDGMPDWWEHLHGFNPVDPSDAASDADADALQNLGEYLAGTDPHDADTEDDLVLDGEEVNVYGTDPLWWDTDLDGMADRYETVHGLDPLDPGDAWLDADGDSYDADGDGWFEVEWTNLVEYQYGRPGGYDEATQGPWLGGTQPRNADSDSDGATDGYEIYWGTDPAMPLDADVDIDDDGLTYQEERALGTDPLLPDTDRDGLCDGGRAPACTWPDRSDGNQPGEAQYGSDPRNSDTDWDDLGDWTEALLWDPDALGVDEDADHDLVGGVTDDDNDGDGIWDGGEVHVYDTDPRDSDTDGDRLVDGDEVFQHGTNPLIPDSDGDDLDDGDEVNVYGTNPLDPDTDGDSLRDDEELFEHGTDPTLADTDGDGLPDGWEVEYGLNPRADDADEDPDDDGARAGDTLPDTENPTGWSLLYRFTNHQEYLAGTDPQNADTDGDVLPDGWEAFFGLDPTTPLADDGPDLDGDGLGELNEFRWRLVPVCVPLVFENCWDHEKDPHLGTGGDGWRDGDEVAYWNDISNDAVSLDAVLTLMEDPDARVDSDGDGSRNLEDLDSDNDSALDGEEFIDLGTYPELRDSDCLVTATSCTVSWDTTSRFDVREGNPGTGDGIPDGAERDAWTSRYGFFSMFVDYDGDGIVPNLLDPDSDNDGLLDGEEFLVHGTDPRLVDTDNDGLSDREEVVETGTNPLEWDSDGDGLPDGWEVEYGLNPRNGADGGLDPDRDAYNPNGNATPEGPWTSLDEYRYAIPISWSVPSNGVWWGGTEPMNPDTDGDGVADGVEAFTGTDPRDGSSVDYRRVDDDAGPDEALARQLAQSDPTNEDLDQLHPVNQAYLENKTARAVSALNETVAGNETAIIDFLADLAEEGVDLVWQQEVLDPVRPVVERVPYVQQVREAPTIIRSVREPVREVADYVDRGVGILEPAVLETVASGSPQPLIDVADQVGPYVADAPLVGEALPAPVRQELQEVAVPTPEEIIAGVEDLQSSPQTPVSEGLALTRALLPTTTPMPTFTADALALAGLTDVYHAMTMASQASGAPHPATVSDVPFYTVLVDHGGTLHVESPLQLGVPIPIDVDGDPATGDPAGFDVEVELTLNAPESPMQPGLPVLPGFRATKLDSTESYEASLHAFVQIPGEQTVAVLGVNQHADALNPVNAAHADLPDDVWLRVTDYKPASEGDAFSAAGLGETRVGFAVQSSAPEIRPVLVQGGLIPYDVTDLDKEPLSGEDHSIGLRLDAIPESTVLEVHDVSDEAANRLDVSWSASQVLDLELVTVDKSGDAGLRQDVKLTGLPRSVSLSQVTVRDSDERHVTYTADASMQEMVFYSRHEDPVLGESRKVYADVTDVPATFTLDVVPAADHYQYTSSAPFTTAVVELSPEGDTCYGTMAVHYLVMEESGCTVARVKGLESFQADLIEGSSSASWTRTPDAGGLDVVADGASSFLLKASNWPTTGSFGLVEAAGAQDFTWTSSAVITDLLVTGDTRSEAGGVYYRFNVTDLPTSLTGSVDTQNRVYDIDASAAITLVDFAYTTKPTREALELGTDFLAMDRGDDGLSVSGRIHGFKNALVDLANGDLLHVDSDITTLQPLRVVYQGPEGAVDAYLSNVPQTVRFDYVYDAVEDRRELDYQASAAITEATLKGNLEGVFFDFHLQDLPTVAGFTADNTEHEWTVAANAPITLLDAVYVKNRGTYQAPASGDFVVFYDEPTNSGVSPDTVVYAAHLTGFQSATITGGEEEFHVESVRASAQPFVLRYGDGADYVEVDVNDLPAYLNATYTPGLLTYTASEPVTSMAFDVHLESPGTGVKILAEVENVPTSLTASWPTTDLDAVQAGITHNGAVPLGPASIEWWDLDADGEGLGLKPYLSIEAASVPNSVLLAYEEQAKTFAVQASGLLEDVTVWSVPRGAATIDVPSTQEYAVIHNAADGRGPVLVSFDGIEFIDAVLAPENAEWGSFHASKLASGSLFVEHWDEAQDTRTQVQAANTPASMDLRFRIDEQDVNGVATIQALDVDWTAGAAIADAYLRVETVDEERGMVKQAILSSPNIPASLGVEYEAGRLLSLDAGAPVTLSGTFGPRDAVYPARSGTDYVFVQPLGGVQALSVDLTALQKADLDLVAGHVHVERTGTEDVELGITLPGLVLALQAQSPPAVVDAWWEQGDGRLLDYQASGGTGSLLFSLDGVDPSRGVPVVVQADVTGLPARVLAESTACGSFQVTTGGTGSIGDAFVAVSRDGSRTVPSLPWAEGAVVVGDECGSVGRAVARITGLTSLSVDGVEDDAAGTFSVHADLQRASSLPGQSFGFHAESPRGAVHATGTGLPQNARLDVVKEEGMDFSLDWLASSIVSDFSAQTSRDGVVTNQARLSSLPTSLNLTVLPAADGGLDLAYTASSAVPDLFADVEMDGMRIRADARDVPLSLTAHVSEDRLTGTVTAGGTFGALDLAFHPVNAAPLAWDSAADALVDLDLSAASGARGRVILDELESVEWLFDLDQESFVVDLHRALGAAGQSVDARVRLDDGLVKVSATGVPSTFSVAADVNPGLASHPLLGFVDGGDVLAAKVTASGVLDSLDLRFTPSEAGASALHVEATQVPSSLEVHVAAVAGGGLVGRYTASGILGSVLVDGEFQGDRVLIDATSAPTSVSFDVSQDWRTGSVVVSGGVLGGLEVALHPAATGPPTLPSALAAQVDSFVVLDAATAGQEALHAFFPAGVDLLSASWSKPVGSKQLSLNVVRSDAAARPSFAAVAAFPGEAFEAVASELPTLMRFDSPSTGVFDARIEGAMTSAELHSVYDPGDGLTDDLYVQLAGVPAWVGVNAALHAVDNADLTYTASGPLASALVEGVYAGTHLNVAMEGVPASLSLANHAVPEGSLVRTTGSLNASAPIGHIEAVVYPDGAAVAAPTLTDTLYVAAIPDGSGELIYGDLSGVQEASWSLLMPADRLQCPGVEDFDVTAGLTRAAAGDVRFLYDGNCGKYADVALTNAPPVFGFETRQGVAAYIADPAVTTGGATIHVEGLDQEGPDNRLIESVKAQLTGLTGDFSFQSAEFGTLAVRGGSIENAVIDAQLGPRLPGGPPLTNPPLDLAVQVEIDHLEMTLANGAYSKIATAPDSQISLYQDEDAEFALYAELNEFKFARFLGGPDGNDPCKQLITELIYETQVPNRDLTVAFDVQKESACEAKDGYRDRFAVELVDMPSEVRIEESEMKFHLDPFGGKPKFFLDTTVNLDLDGPLGAARLSIPVYGNDVQVFAVAEGVPAGQTLVRAIKYGKALDLALQPSGGVVERVRVGIVAPKENVQFTLTARDVNVRFQFDLDGDTRYSEVPVYFFVDTGGHFVDMDLLAYSEDYGFQVTFDDVYADHFQLYRGAAKKGCTFFLPNQLEDICYVRMNGYLNIIGEADLKIKVMGQWYDIE